MQVPPVDLSPLSPVIVQLVGLALTAVAVWLAKGAKAAGQDAAASGKQAAVKADDAAIKAGDAVLEAKNAASEAVKAASAGDTHRQLISQSLNTIQHGTEVVRTQTNGNTSELIAEIRELTRQ